MPPAQRPSHLRLLISQSPSSRRQPVVTSRMRPVSGRLPPLPPVSTTVVRTVAWSPCSSTSSGPGEIGRASFRERVWSYVYILVVVVSLKNQNTHRTTPPNNTPH